MSNPTIVTEQFNGSLGSFTGVNPIRYDSGLLLESAITNLVPNPVAGTNATGWFTDANVQASRVTSLPGPLPSWLASVVTTGIRVTALTNRTATYLAIGPSVTLIASTLYQHGMYVWVPTAMSATGLQVWARNFVGSTITLTNVDLTKRDQWQWVGSQVTPVGGDLAGDLGLQVSAGTMLTGEFIYVTCAAVQREDGATSPAVGSMGTGYAFTGTAHASTSTRAASSASVTIAEPASVACWYREGYSGAKSFAYLEPYGTLGTYGSIAYAAGDLTISTSRNLVIGPFAAFDRALTAGEQANLRSTQNWTMNSVNGSNIILPLSGARRRRR